MAILNTEHPSASADSRIDWVRANCRLLSGLEQEYAVTRPFAGLTIGTNIHLEPKTVALLLTLQTGGARIVATGNMSSTQPKAVAYLRDRGIEVHADRTLDSREHAMDVNRVAMATPDIILDNGGDLFLDYLDHPWPGLRGGTEETTSGRARLEPVRAQLNLPVLVINDSSIKQFAENRHAVGQSVLEAFMRITNLATNGRRVAVFGYGACGKGVAATFRNAYAQVSVVEVDPVARLEALFDGFDVPDRETALSEAQLIVTVTGRPDVVTAADLDLLRDDTVLCNAGHFPWEIDVPAITDSALVADRWEERAPGITTYRLVDDRRIHLLGNGHMVNLAGAGPLGNSIQSMDIGFALQARCLELVAAGSVGPEHAVVPVPRDVERAVAEAYLRAYQPRVGAST